MLRISYGLGKKQRDKKISDTYSGHYAAASRQIWNRGNTTPKQQK